jgi:hypothetical protein
MNFYFFCSLNQYILIASVRVILYVRKPKQSNLINKIFVPCSILDILVDISFNLTITKLDFDFNLLKNLFYQIAFTELKYEILINLN